MPRLWRARLLHRRDEFCRFCWPDRFGLAFNDLHRSLFAASDVLAWNERRQDIREAVAAPRGFAKSTIASFADVAHAIVYGLEAYVVLLSAGGDLAKSLSRDLLEQFRAKDSTFARTYGPFVVRGGVEAWEVSVRGKPSVGVIAKSFGKEVRGIKHPTRGIRPTLIVIDDGEKKDRVRNPDMRYYWWQVLTKDVMKLGRREGGTRFRVVGTILHPDSMLARLMKEVGWQSRRWQAVVEWPERKDLWERCQRIWTDLSLGAHREAAARAFYTANREEMDRGAVVLDPATKGIYDLHLQIWAEGWGSFLQEMQNDPVDPTAQIFVSEKFVRFRALGNGTLEVHDTGADGSPRTRLVRVADLRIHGRWDPAAGTPHGDFAAIAIVGRDELGYSYVLDCWMRRAKPSEQLAAAWALAERWGCRRMTVESNGFQALCAEPYTREREERREAGLYWQLQIEPEPAHEDKKLRIATMEPDCTNGWMCFSDVIPHEVLEQFDQHPSSAHDDGPDAIHGAWRAVGGRPAGMAR